MKKFIFICVAFLFSLSPLFAADNMRIFSKENGEVITGFQPSYLPEAIKITIAYPTNYLTEPKFNYPIVLLFDNKEYKIEDLRQMFYFKKSKNPQSLIASLRFNKDITQEQFEALISDIFAFFELNYRAQSDADKRLILAKDNFALLALNSINKEANYFFNLGMILNNSTALPIFDKPFKKQLRLFAFSQMDNLLRLQNLLEAGSLEPLQNFFFQIKKESSFENFDLRYFFSTLPKVKTVKPVFKKEILPDQDEPFYLQVKTSYGLLNFWSKQITFAPPVLVYDEQDGLLKVLLAEPQKIKLSGIFGGKKWSCKTKIK